MLELGLKLTLAYLLGSVMGGMLLGALRGGVDLRKSGSGNVGGTNAFRTQGAKFAAGVLLVDIGKGILAAAVIAPFAIPGIGNDEAVHRDLVLYGVAFAAILGHVFPVWHNFQGGKGGATAAGLLCFFAPAAGIAIIVFWVAVILLTGFVGLATMAASIAAAVMLAWLRLPEGHGLVVFAASVAALIVYTHRGNIERMLKGTESRFGKRKA